MIQAALLDGYRAAAQRLEHTVHGMTEAQFLAQPATGRWSPAQHVEHLALLGHSMARAVSNPPKLAEKFGTISRESRGYDAIAEAYNAATNGQGKAPEYLVPQHAAQSREEQLGRFRAGNEAWIASAAMLTPEQLSTHHVPHPFIGMLTLQEFLSFMNFHMDHHHRLVRVG